MEAPRRTCSTPLPANQALPCAPPLCPCEALGSERKLGSHGPDLLDPPVKSPQSRFTLHAMPLFPIAHALLERGQQVKSDIRGLKILRIRLRHVMHERSE